VRFSVPGRVRGKGRPRASSRGGFVRMYTDAKTTACEATVKHFASEAMKGKPLFEGPLWLSVTVWVLHPQSWSKKRKAASIYVTGKPDCDNVLKLIGDALNGIVWKDDSQLADAHIVRKFTTEAERVEIEVGNLTAPALIEVPQPSRLPFRVLSKDEVEAA
jgi:Holliday junction resolvase RusA-like endonuclease